MLGGGPGAFIGNIHRLAIAQSQQAELVAGVFSQNHQNSLKLAESLALNPTRVYNNYQNLFKNEKQYSGPDPIDFVVVVTPNHLHYEMVQAGLYQGFHVVCDKPLCTNSLEAQKLYQLAQKNNRILALTYNYTGYPMVKEAQKIIQKGEIGKIRRITVEYLQGWLSEDIENTGAKQAAWRTQASLAGKSCCVGDIGTHAENMIHYLTGLDYKRLSAHLNTFVEGRQLEDDAHILLEYPDGIQASIFASQVLEGEENNFSVRIYGSEGHIKWYQEKPFELTVYKKGQPLQIYKAGNDYLNANTTQHHVLPPGHPEGFIEAFANIYKSIIQKIQNPEKAESSDFPNGLDGLRGVHFVEDVLKSHQIKTWINSSFKSNIHKGGYS